MCSSLMWKKEQTHFVQVSCRTIIWGHRYVKLKYKANGFVFSVKTEGF